jgi:hypothetical protein
VQHEQHHGNKNAYENEEYPCAGNVHSRHYALEGSVGTLQSIGVDGETNKKGAIARALPIFGDSGSR